MVPCLFDTVLHWQTWTLISAAPSDLVCKELGSYVSGGSGNSAEEGGTAPSASCGIWLCESAREVRALCKHRDRHLNPTEILRQISTVCSSIRCSLAGKPHLVRPH